MILSGDKEARLMFSHVLMVCHGNICRSPVAQYMLQEMLKDSHPHVAIDSSGVGALIGYPAAPEMRQLMTDRGIDLSLHTAKQINLDLVNWSDLILVMDGHQRIFIEKKFPSSRGKTQLLGRWLDIEEVPDPYGKSLQDYVKSINLIERCLTEWQKKVWR